MTTECEGCKEIEEIKSILNGKDNAPGIKAIVYSMDQWMASSKSWRLAILGVIASLIIQGVSIAYFFGRLSYMVEQSSSDGKEFKIELSNIRTELIRIEGRGEDNQKSDNDRMDKMDKKR